MTDQTPVEALDESLLDERTSDADTPDTPDTGTLEETETASNPNAEAIKYRLRAREAEAALATAQARIELLQRAEVERVASEHLSHPSDIFTMSGNDLVSFLDDNGSVDLGKITADVGAILAERPGLRKSAAAVDPSQGMGSNPPKAVPSWGALLAD